MRCSAYVPGVQETLRTRALRASKSPASCRSWRTCSFGSREGVEMGWLLGAAVQRLRVVACMAVGTGRGVVPGAAPSPVGGSPMTEARAVMSAGVRRTKARD